MATQARDLPEPRGGIQWVLLGPADSTELHGLIRKLEERDQALFRTSLAEVEEMLGRPGVSYVVGGYLDEGVWATSAQSLVDEPQALVAFGYVGLARSGKAEAICHGGVLPQHRYKGIGQSVLDWQTGRGAALIRDAFPGEQGRITHAVDSRRTNLHSHLESLGYQWTHSYAELRHDLTTLPQPGELPPFVEIVPWSDQWEELARKTYNRAAQKSDRGEVQSAEQWSEARAHLDPALSFIAVDRVGDRARVVGLVEVGRYEQDWKALGWKEGYIDTVAVFEVERRGVLLHCLMARAMHAIADAGMEKAAVGLDPQSDPEMMAFYDSVGFKPHAWWRHYASVVSP